MRNAAAHFDDDFASDEPARKKAPRRAPSGKPAAGKRKTKGKSRFRFDVDMHKVARWAAIGMSATVAVGIMVNALVMQKSRHPAPLFGKSVTFAGPASTPLPPKAPPRDETPQEEPDQKAAIKAATMAPPPPPAATRSASREKDAAPPSNDAIARLLQGGSVPADQADTKSVLGAQRALAKLGFTLKPTGTFGPQTKKAIEHFQKDHHMPVNGELSRRLIKVLAAESGLKIDR